MQHVILPQCSLFPTLSFICCGWQALDVCIALLDPHTPEPSSPSADRQDSGSLQNGGPQSPTAGGSGGVSDEYRRVSQHSLQSLQSKAVTGVAQHMDRLSEMLVDSAAPPKLVCSSRPQLVDPWH